MFNLITLLTNFKGTRLSSAQFNKNIMFNNITFIDDAQSSIN